MSPRAFTTGHLLVAVTGTVAGAWIPSLSDQQFQAALCAFGCTVLFAALAAPFVRSTR
ncbi:hypothetical protein [Myxococcus virescens]|uniref:Uncharacterized protein n=1 Tax=Myxococcus virescens TaxID=83456 RepID=A0A511HNK1_9BACT|nr:hypothetical protein [Myxococcus virescens]GEL75178.1 hypothetical protein MVI01_69620 [Myxococcus virescens]SDD64585.1 hypothetical protein SAMN04488504_102103 [Myxococcus virescens]